MCVPIRRFAFTLFFFVLLCYQPVDQSHSIRTTYSIWSIAICSWKSNAFLRMKFGEEMLSLSHGEREWEREREAEMGSWFSLSKKPFLFLRERERARLWFWKGRRDRKDTNRRKEENRENEREKRAYSVLSTFVLLIMFSLSLWKKKDWKRKDENIQYKEIVKEWFRNA